MVYDAGGWGHPPHQLKALDKPKSAGLADTAQIIDLIPGLALTVFAHAASCLACKLGECYPRFSEAMPSHSVRRALKS